MRLPAALLLVVTFGACASTRPLDRARPIEIERRWSGTTFRQEGVRIDSVDLFAAFTATPTGREHVRSTTRNGVTSLVFNALSIGLLVGAVTSGDPATSWSLLGAGLGANVGAHLFHHRAQSGLAAAAAEYNASLPPPPSAPEPTSTRVRPARGEWGLSLAFEL
jgi:hypothetical protein